jgi:hypothetical protein
MRTPIAFLVGALAATLVAAAAFRGGGQPLDSTFTYQGQLRNAGQLVNGNVDVRFTLWDADVGGTQIGNANSFTNYPLTDGRFALGLNFGTGAFNGDQRWVQVEFRSPAGTGQYLTLAPRDKILATPYALYALNSTASQWDYNPKTQALTSAQNVTKVGIGTASPTAALEVVAAGGDDSVKLPAGSIGPSEVAVSLLPSAASLAFSGSASMPGTFPGGSLIPVAHTFSTGSAGFLSVFGFFTENNGYPCTVWVDGVSVGTSLQVVSGQQYAVTVPIAAGSHTLEIRSIPFAPCTNCGYITAKTVGTATFAPSPL